MGPLHGLPVSLKDQFHVKDVETTMGYIGVSTIDDCFSEVVVYFRDSRLFNMSFRHFSRNQSHIKQDTPLICDSGLAHSKARKVPGKRKSMKVKWSGSFAT